MPKKDGGVEVTEDIEEEEEEEDCECDMIINVIGEAHYQRGTDFLMAFPL